ncbi:MAG: MarR family transcriptional regulator, partial [Gammaproteobacteria bacterium]|nr:MarR family transcriptional regulator [Gammaproteobacteria bacterium]
RAISQNNEWTAWIDFFLRAVIAQANLNTETLKQIMSLYEVTKKQISELTRSPHSAQLVDALFDKPIFTTANIAQRANIPKPTVHKLINALIEEGLLETVRAAAGRRPAILMFTGLLDVLEGR